ncbi:unnamed protein product [Ranitomeya imitator]|uniref:Helix-turn-helix domain-containing protein n=1 Tax=Ranitomeya imitator TaxID=111125 RepID=A0ABN9LTJ4_9NEOB|nr:unnamed protein product [Ranitomeya imitator]
MDVYRKSTSVNALLHAGSAHNYSTVRAVPVGQFLRMRRICSTDNRFLAQAEDLRGRFEARGYSHRTIKRGFERARRTPRRDLLYPKTSKRETQTEGDRVRFITTYNHEWTNMREILRKHWSVLLTEPSLASAVGEFPSMTARRSPNLGNLLVRSHYVPPTVNPFSTRGPLLGSFKVYDIRHHITCGTSNVIYYATCGCSLIYVGLTSRELRLRVREHVRDIRAARTATDDSDLKALPRHFKLFHDCDAGTLQVRGIDYVHLGVRGGNYKKVLAQREAAWIVRLNTMTPTGLNESLSFSSFLG